MTLVALEVRYSGQGQEVIRTLEDPVPWPHILMKGTGRGILGLVLKLHPIEVLWAEG